MKQHLIDLKLPGALSLALVLACSRTQPTPEANRQAPPAKPSITPPAAPLPRPEPSVVPPSAHVPLAVALDPQSLEMSIALVRPERRYNSLRLHALQGAFLATLGSEVFRFENGQLVGQEIAFVAEHPVMTFASLGGRYPDSISGTADIGSPTHSERGDFYEYQTLDFYGPITKLVAEYNAIPGAAWTQGSRLVYRNQSFVASLGPPNQAVPKVAESTHRDCGVLFDVKAFNAAPDGAVVAAGTRCGAAGSMVERWAAGKSEGRAFELPSVKPFPEATVFAVVLGAGHRAVVLATSASHSSLWQETPNGWRELSMPVLPEPSSIAVAADGAIWLVSRPAVSKRERPRAYWFHDDRWTALTFPTEQALREKLGGASAPEALWVRPNNFVIRGDSVYLSAAVMQGNDATVGALILQPATAATADGASTVAEPSGCTPQVVLFSVSKTTPADYQYPATKDAIVGSPFARSAEFLEVTRDGKRTLIAKTKTRQDADALAARIRERIAGSRPTVVCQDVPQVLRKISIE